MARFVVRYGVMRMVGVFSSRSDSIRRGTQVIARTTRGLEVGDVLCEATEQAVAQLVDPPSGQILREMSPEDTNEATHLKTRERDEFEACQRHVASLKLPMQLVDVEHLFGGERIVVYYLSEERVDFRELVKVLANEFQTRIEMRQIGVRDEAKLLADYGDCGKPVCCNTHLVEMPPVSMKMAKLQKATLDPTKISGRCGRLKCCLRYEYDTYEDLQKTLPPIGADVVTTTGRARILNHEILSQQLLVHTEDNRRLLIPATDVLSVIATAATRARNDRGDRERGGDRGERPDGRRPDRSPADQGAGPQDEAPPSELDQQTLNQSHREKDTGDSPSQEERRDDSRSQSPQGHTPRGGSPPGNGGRGDRGPRSERRGDFRDRRGRDDRRPSHARPEQGTDRPPRDAGGADGQGGEHTAGEHTAGERQAGDRPSGEGGRGPRDRAHDGDRRNRRDRGPRGPRPDAPNAPPTDQSTDSPPTSAETRANVDEASPPAEPVLPPPPTMASDQSSAGAPLNPLPPPPEPSPSGDEPGDQKP